MADAELTLHEAAAELGVHYMTAYRYVRLGMLPATKQGGTWRVQRDDLEALRQVAEPVAGARGGRRPAPWAERLESRLLAGDARGSWSVVESALAAGVELEQIYTDVLAPAMRSIGDRWERGEVNVALEHRASGIAMRLIGRLGPRFVRRGRTRGAVVAGAPVGERHSLPLAIVSDLVRHHGWEVSDLGGDVPEGSFVHAVLTTPDVVGVGISVTTQDNLLAAANVAAAIRAAAPKVLLVAGGAAVRGDEHARALGFDAWAADGDGFAGLLSNMARRDDALEVSEPA